MSKGFVLVRIFMDMTEHEMKEIGKWFLDNGHRKLTQSEKAEIKSAIDQAGV